MTPLHIPIQSGLGLNVFNLYYSDYYQSTWVTIMAQDELLASSRIHIDGPVICLFGERDAGDIPSG